MSVTITIKKQKTSEYDAELTVTNNTSSVLTNWVVTATLPNGSSITKSKKYTASINGNILTLTPDSKIESIDSGDSVSQKIKGIGSVPTDWKLVGGTPVPPIPPSPGGSVPNSLDPPIIPSSATIVYNIQFNKLSKITDLSTMCKFQYSYNQQNGFTDTNPNPAYFALSGTSGIKVSIYSGDKPFESGNKTEPRSEMRFLASITDGRKYVYGWDQYTAITPTFDNGIGQVFGTDGPAYIIRWRSGTYQVLQDQGDKVILKFTDPSITPTTDTGVWVRWRFEFMGDNKNGYSRLYRNDVLMCSNSGVDTSIGNNAYLKNGIYAQQMQPNNDVVVYKDNFICYYT